MSPSRTNTLLTTPALGESTSLTDPAGSSLPRTATVWSILAVNAQIKLPPNSTEQSQISADDQWRPCST